MTNDYIQFRKPLKDKKAIHKLYTPKEIVYIIQLAFNEEMVYNDLSRGEKLLLWDSFNSLIRRFKDD